GSQPCVRISFVSLLNTAPLRACIGTCRTSRQCWLEMYSLPSQSTRPCSRLIGASHGSLLVCSATAASAAIFIRPRNDDTSCVFVSCMSSPLSRRGHCWWVVPVQGVLLANSKEP